MDTQTLDFSRTMNATPSRVFALMTDSQLRQSWNSPGEGFTVTVTDPAPATAGARETALVTADGEPDTTVHTNWATVSPETLVYTETLDVDEAPIAASFVAATIAPDGAQTTLTLHIEIVSFAGQEMLEGYRMGWDTALEQLTKIS